MCATAGQGGDRTSEDAVDLAGEVAFEFPESSQATARLCSARRVRGVVGRRAGVPAGPDDPQPGAGDDAGGVWVAFACDHPLGPAGAASPCLA
jgi:hypothetical protein